MKLLQSDPNDSTYCHACSMGQKETRTNTYALLKDAAKVWYCLDHVPRQT